MKKPIIGITTDIEQPGENKFAKYAPWYAVRDSYSNAVGRHDAIPVLLPHHIKLVDDYLDMIDGLIPTGGDFDIDPTLYGEKEIHPTVTIKRSRTDFEYAMVEGALKRNMPVLGICGGEQLINVVMGGNLIQHIPDFVDAHIGHEQGKKGVPSTQSSHHVDIVADSLLAKITGAKKLKVNSTHHQAVRNIGKGLKISAMAEDGVVEAIESTKHKFCIGVQWHPEYEINHEEVKLFEAFVAACR